MVQFDFMISMVRHKPPHAFSNTTSDAILKQHIEPSERFLGAGKKSGF